MNCARNYENLLNFVKVMSKILVVPTFSGQGVFDVVMLDNVLCFTTFKHNRLPAAMLLRARDYVVW